MDGVPLTFDAAILHIANSTIATGLHRGRRAHQPTRLDRTVAEQSKKLKDWATERIGLPKDKFVHKYPHAFLVESEHTAGPAMAAPAFTTMVLSQKDIKELMAGEAEAQAGAQVRPLVKNAMSNAFADMISVGRTTNNDIVIRSPAVSKFHAHFSRNPSSGAYTLTDAGATNGTFVNGTRLAPKTTIALRDGDQVTFSQQFAFTFHSAEGFYDSLARD